MSEMMISDAAKNEIRHIFRENRYQNPVAVLYESADAGRLPSAIDRDSAKELIERFHKTRDQLSFVLMVGVDDRAKFETKDLFEAGNITFVLAPMLAERLKGCALIFESDRFLLMGPDNVTYALLSSFF
jgi:hypothetical protein